MAKIFSDRKSALNQRDGIWGQFMSDFQGKDPERPFISRAEAIAKASALREPEAEIQELERIRENRRHQRPFERLHSVLDSDCAG